MIKGCSKKIYHIKNIGGKYFDEAYFILRSDESPTRDEPPSATLAEEAERIIKEAAQNYKPAKKHTGFLGRALSFAMGAFTSSAIIGTVALFMSL